MKGAEWPFPLQTLPTTRRNSEIQDYYNKNKMQINVNTQQSSILENTEPVFSAVPKERTRGDWHKVKHRKLHLHIRRKKTPNLQGQSNAGTGYLKRL